MSIQILRMEREKIIAMMFKIGYLLLVLFVLYLIYYSFMKIPLDSDTAGRVTKAKLDPFY